MAAATDVVADALAVVAEVDQIAAEIIFSAEYEANGPDAYVAPEWIRRWGARLDPDCSQTEEVRSFTAAACAEFPDDADAVRWVGWMFAAGLSSRARPERSEAIRAMLAEVLPPYVAAARATQPA